MADGTPDVVAEALEPTVDPSGITEVAPGVHVIPDRRVDLVPNVGIVVGEDAVLVVDTAMGSRNAQLVLDAARELADGRRLLLTITHFHPEHGYGAHVFRPEATIVVNEAQADELRQKGHGYLELFRTFGPHVATALEGVEIVEPHVAYRGDGATIDLGGRRVELRTWGLAHTRGDQVVFLPEERILFAGDLLEDRFFAIFPYFPPDDVDVDGSRWIDACDRMSELDPAIVVPGHGDVGDRSIIAAQREYIALLRAETERLAGEGKGAEEISAELTPSLERRYPDWDNPQWIDFGVKSFLATRG